MQTKLTPTRYRCKQIRVRKQRNMCTNYVPKKQIQTTLPTAALCPKITRRPCDWSHDFSWLANRAVNSGLWQATAVINASFARYTGRVSRYIGRVWRYSGRVSRYTGQTPRYTGRVSRFTGRVFLTSIYSRISRRSFFHTPIYFRYHVDLFSHANLRAHITKIVVTKKNTMWL